jgi:hypothetical protein
LSRSCTRSYTIARKASLERIQTDRLLVKAKHLGLSGMLVGKTSGV